MAQAATKRSASARTAEDPVEKFRDAYADALGEAETSEQHTNTEGWQALYVQFKKEQQDAWGRIAAELRELADSVERVGTGEGEEKQIGDIKKRCVELRGVRETFERTTVHPVKEPVDRCNDLINDALRDVQILEDRDPMHSAGLVNRMRGAVEVVNRVEWGHESGRVRIKAPRPLD